MCGELANPCQVIVPMDEDNGYGFGHLRFQEYLASLEIARWSFDDFRIPMKDTWWHDVFRLWAFRGRDFDKLFLKYPLQVLPIESRDCMLRIFDNLSDFWQYRVIQTVEDHERDNYLSRGGAAILKSRQIVFR